MNASGFLTFIFCWVSISAVTGKYCNLIQMSMKKFSFLNHTHNSRNFSYSATGHSSCKGYDCFKEYVDKKDSVYEWSDTGHRLHGLDPLHLKSWTGYVLNFTSQQWLTPEDSSRSIWWHYLVIIVPKEVKYPDQSFLWIASVNAGNMEDDMPSALQPDILLAGDFAVQAQTPAAVVFHVPNQPIVFPNDPLGENHKRTENAVLAYTWWHYMFDPEANPEWVIRLPMAKAAVRAMDTVTAYMTSESAPEEIKGSKKC